MTLYSSKLYYIVQVLMISVADGLFRVVHMDVTADHAHACVRQKRGDRVSWHTLHSFRIGWGLAPPIIGQAWLMLPQFCSRWLDLAQVKAVHIGWTAPKIIGCYYTRCENFWAA